VHGRGKQGCGEIGRHDAQQAVGQKRGGAIAVKNRIRLGHHEAADDEEDGHGHDTQAHVAQQGALRDGQQILEMLRHDGDGEAETEGAQRAVTWACSRSLRLPGRGPKGNGMVHDVLVATVRPRIKLRVRRNQKISSQSSRRRKEHRG
jgi:hypothetical protein